MNLLAKTNKRNSITKRLGFSVTKQKLVHALNSLGKFFWLNVGQTELLPRLCKNIDDIPSEMLAVKTSRFID